MHVFNTQLLQDFRLNLPTNICWVFYCCTENMQKVFVEVQANLYENEHKGALKGQGALII